MNQQLALLLAVVSLMQFTSICVGRSVEDQLDMLVKRGSEEDELDMLVRRRSPEDELDMLVKREYDDNGDSHEDYVYYGDLNMFDKRSTKGLTAVQKEKVITIHNTLRRGEGASDMQLLKYSNRLAQLAQDWSDKCNWGHRPRESFSASDYGFSSVGENIWMWTGDSNTIPEKPIQDWFDEKAGYVYNSNHCAKPPCGHYTAVVWANTQEVGCGLTRCPTLHNAGANNAYFFVCNYGPAGNMMGEKPFKKGAACSECSSGHFYCTQGLCDHTCRQAASGGRCECKVRCENGSPTPDCKCRCNPGYSGVRCSERCEDKNPQCGANPGWPVKMCHDKSIFGGMMYDQVNEQCPKMCGKCS